MNQCEMAGYVSGKAAIQSFIEKAVFFFAHRQLEKAGMQVPELVIKQLDPDYPPAA